MATEMSRHLPLFVASVIVFGGCVLSAMALPATRNPAGVALGAAAAVVILFAAAVGWLGG